MDKKQQEIIAAILAAGLNNGTPKEAVEKYFACLEKLEQEAPVPKAY